MNSPNREEIDAKLQTVEARLDGRVLAIQVAVDAILRRIAGLSERMARLETRVDQLRTTVVVTAISASVATVLGVAAFNAALSSNMLAAMKAGGDMTVERAEVRRQIAETDALLKRIEAQLPPPPQTPVQQSGK
jgi:hypothetical protein